MNAGLAEERRHERFWRPTRGRRPKGFCPRWRRLRVELLEDRRLLSTGLYIDGIVSLGDSPHPFDTIQVHFSEPIQDSSFALQEDVRFRQETGEEIQPHSLTRLDDDLYELDLAGLTGSDVYELEIGPAILDTQGQPMDQDHDGVPGEVDEDVCDTVLFSQDVTIDSSATEYDGRGFLIHGHTATIDGPHQLASLGVYGGGTLSHTPEEETGLDAGLNLTIVDNVIVDGTSPKTSVKSFGN